MPRVCFFMPLVLFLSACAADIQPFAIADKVGKSMPGKGIIACTGLPVGGEKCDVELPELSADKAASAQTQPASSSSEQASHAGNAAHG